MAAEFMIDVTGTPKSPWNVAAGRSFADHFIKKMGYDDTGEMRTAIETAFATRVGSLRSLHKKEDAHR